MGLLIRADAQAALEARVMASTRLAWWPRGRAAKSGLGRSVQRIRELAALGASVGRLAGHHPASAGGGSTGGCRIEVLQPQSGDFATIFPAAMLDPHVRRPAANDPVLEAGRYQDLFGGIIGLGETREDRCDLALALREIEADMVPFNILNPIEGTPFAGNPPVPPMDDPSDDCLFPLHSPAQNSWCGGGRSICATCRAWLFLAGATR